MEANLSALVHVYQIKWGISMFQNIRTVYLFENIREQFFEGKGL
jgi:hypothetical protein